MLGDAMAGEQQPVLERPVALWPPAGETGRHAAPGKPPGPAGGDGDGERPLSSLHVLQRLRLVDEAMLEDPYLSNVFEADEFLAFADYHHFEVDVAHAVRSGTTTYARVIRDGFWRRVWEYGRNFDIIEDRQPLSLQRPVPVGELHCPAVAGSQSTFTGGREESRSVGLTVRAGGAGGGGWTQKIVFHDQSVITIDAGHCAALVADLSGDFSIWRHLDDRTRVEVLINFTGVGQVYDVPLEEGEDYDPDLHLCARADGYARLESEVATGRLRINEEYVSFAPRGDSAAPYRYGASWSREREYRRQWGLTVPGPGGAELTAGGEIVSRFVRTIQLEVSCPRNRRYVGRFRSARALPQQWAASPPLEPSGSR